MTKKDYIIIAQAIAEAHTRTYNTSFGLSNQIINNIALALKKQNPLFNMDKFFVACGVNNK